VISAVAASSLLSMTVLGSLSAYAGGAKLLVSVARITFWGAAAMILTVAVGRLFGATV